MKSFAPPRRLLQLLALAGVSAFSSPLWAQSSEVTITENARAHFRAGVSFLQDPDGARYGEAYHEFKVAYAESPSWKILGNLGITSMKLERDGEAIVAFDTYLKEAGNQIDAAERAQVSRDLDTLKAGVTWVTITSNPVGAAVVDTRLPVAGQAIENRYDSLREPLRIGVHSGRHRITVELDGYQPAVWSFDAKGGELEYTFELVARTVEPTLGGGAEAVDKVYERPVPTAVWIGVAATGAFTAGAVVTGILALGKHDEFDSATSAADAASAKSSGETLNLTTDILMGAAVVAAGTTAVLYFTRPQVEVDPTHDTAFRVSPTMLPGGGGLWMQGSF